MASQITAFRLDISSDCVHMLVCNHPTHLPFLSVTPLKLDSLSDRLRPATVALLAAKTLGLVDTLLFLRPDFTFRLRLLRVTGEPVQSSSSLGALASFSCSSPSCVSLAFCLLRCNLRLTLRFPFPDGDGTQSSEPRWPLSPSCACSSSELT